jgi:hypothetical protein
MSRTPTIQVARYNENKALITDTKLAPLPLSKHENKWDIGLRKVTIDSPSMGLKGPLGLNFFFLF